MSRRTPNPESVKQQVERRRMEQDAGMLIREFGRFKWAAGAHDADGQFKQAETCDRAADGIYAELLDRINRLQTQCSEDRMKTGFEKYADLRGMSLEMTDGVYKSSATRTAWRAWVIALSSHNEAPVSFGRGRE